MDYDYQVDGVTAGPTEIRRLYDKILELLKEEVKDHQAYSVYVEISAHSDPLDRHVTGRGLDEFMRGAGRLRDKITDLEFDGWAHFEPDRSKGGELSDHPARHISVDVDSGERTRISLSGDQSWTEAAEGKLAPVFEPMERPYWLHRIMTSASLPLLLMVVVGGLVNHYGGGLEADLLVAGLIGAVSSPFGGMLGLIVPRSRIAIDEKALKSPWYYDAGYDLTITLIAAAIIYVLTWLFT